MSPFNIRMRSAFFLSRLPLRSGTVPVRRGVENVAGFFGWRHARSLHITGHFCERTGGRVLEALRM